MKEKKAYRVTIELANDEFIVFCFHQSRGTPKGYCSIG
jgi:hypothetical protein